MDTAERTASIAALKRIETEQNKKPRTSPEVLGGRGKKGGNSELARKAGVNEKTVRTSLTLAKGLGDGDEDEGAKIATRIAGTALGKKKEVEALVKLPKDVRAKVIEKVEKGERVLASKVRTSTAVSDPRGPKPGLFRQWRS